MAKLSAKRSVINWIKRNDPNIYRLAVKKHGLRKGLKVRQLSGIDDSDIESLGGVSDFFSTLTETVKQVVPAVTQYKAQNKILNAQLDRAKRGLPPLNVEDYSPVMRISPSFDPQSEAALTRMATSTVSRFALPLAIGLGAFLLLRRRRG